MLALVLAGCTTSPWRQVEVGDVLDVRGRQLVMRGDDTLVGGVAWGFEVDIAPQRVPRDLRRVRFGVGTAARWTLRADASDGAAWPNELAVASAGWHLVIEEGTSVRHHAFDLPAGQRLVRSLPCDASECAYVFAEADAHRDVFTLNVVLGQSDGFDALLAEVERGVVGLAWLLLHVDVHSFGDPLPRHLDAVMPLAPSGITLEFRP